jgi:serine protease inhibitor
MTSAFNPGSADFSRIDSLKDLYISRVLQKTYIDLNEEGTEAAAVTVVEIGKTTAFVPLVFNANRPFIYAITEQSTGVVLFIGKMMDPTEAKVEL